MEPQERDNERSSPNGPVLSLIRAMIETRCDNVLPLEPIAVMETEFTMTKHNLGQQDADASFPIDRRALLTTAGKTVAGLAVGGALLSAAPTAALADHERLRSIGILRKPPVPLTFTLLGGGDFAVALQKLADIFHAQNPGIAVTVRAVDAPNWSGYLEKILTQLAGGQPLDLIDVATEGVQLFGAKDLALPLDPFIKRDAHELADFYSDVSPILTEGFKYKGKTLALPFVWNNMVMFYNTTLFKKAGIAPPSATWTGADFRAIARKLRAVGAYGFNPWAGGTFGIVAWMYAAGGALYNSDLTKSNATDPANIAAMQFLHDLVWTDKTSPRPGGPDFPLLEAGRVGMIAAGRWPVLPFDQAKFNAYDIQYFPKLSPHRKTIVGVGGYPIYRQTQHPEEAWTYVKFLASRQAMDYITASGFSVPARRSSSYNPKLMNPPHNYRIYYDSLAAARSVPAPPQFNEVESALNAAYTKMMANEMTPSDMMTTLDRQITSILAKPV